MFQVYVTHPMNAASGWTPEKTKTDLDSALVYAFERIALIDTLCRVWIETEAGEKLALMN